MIGPVDEAATRQPDDPREPRMVPLADRLTRRLANIPNLTGLFRRTIELLRSAGEFPKPDLTVGKTPLWRPETLRAWVERGGGE